MNINFNNINNAYYSNQIALNKIYGQNGLLLWEKETIPTPVGSFIVFSSTKEFYIVVSYSGNHHWNGTIECSRDGIIWSTWTGYERTSLMDSYGIYRLYFRGKNNTIIGDLWSIRPTTSNTSIKVSCHGDIRNLLNYTNVNNTTMDEYCFKQMFEGSPLTTAPELPATTLASYCYYKMFYNCNYLTTAPELPATTLANHCYNAMFESCYGLTTAPELPATTLANYCYYEMFAHCTSLTTAPVLPATTLKSGCYSFMFSNCTILNYIKAMFTTKPSTTYTENWLKDVAETGTFVKNSAATWNVTGISGVPTNWTIQYASS